jgi:hypothetical protein
MRILVQNGTAPDYNIQRKNIYAPLGWEALLYSGPSLLDEVDESIGGAIVAVHLILARHFRFNGLTRASVTKS